MLRGIFALFKIGNVSINLTLELQDSCFYFQDHKESCEQLKIPCVYPECGELIRKPLLSQHLENECPCRPVQCKHCGTQLPLNKLEV